MREVCPDTTPAEHDKHRAEVLSQMDAVGLVLWARDCKRRGGMVGFGCAVAVLFQVVASISFLLLQLSSLFVLSFTFLSDFPLSPSSISSLRSYLFLLFPLLFSLSFLYLSFLSLSYTPQPFPLLSVTLSFFLSSSLFHSLPLLSLILSLSYTRQPFPLLSLSHTFTLSLSLSLSSSLFHSLSVNMKNLVDVCERDLTQVPDGVAGTSS